MKRIFFLWWHSRCRWRFLRMTGLVYHNRVFVVFFFFFLKFLEDMSPFCGATDTPVSDFWWCLLLVSKPEWVLSYSSLVEAYVLRYTLSEIHLWCDTCQPLGSQHGSQAISSTYLQGIGGTQNSELSCCRSQREISRCSTDWAIPARLEFVAVSKKVIDLTLLPML